MAARCCAPPSPQRAPLLRCSLRCAAPHSSPQNTTPPSSIHPINATNKQSARREREEQEKLLAEFELRRKIRATLVPTDDGAVRAMLRQLGEPVTLFGEREMERRERLKKIVAERGDGGAAAVAGLEGAPVTGAVVIEQEVAVQKEVFYTEGSEDLKAARLEIARWSLPRAAARVRAARRLRADVGALRRAAAARDAAEAAARRVAQQSSEIADDRPVGGCAFSPSGALLAACGWGGAVNLWRATDSANVARERGWRAHAERATGIAWHPAATLGAHSPDAANLITGCADGTAALFTLEGKQLLKLEGHTDRLGRVAWHPMGRHVATASFDATWRLWDAETGGCLLEQEGHSRAVYAVALHPDGALAASVGLDAAARLWDMRTGRCVHVLEGHVKPALCADFAPDGVTLATGGDDHSARVWDLRARRCARVLPAHRSLVSAVRFAPGGGRCLLTAGYDAAAKLWSTRDWSLLRALAGHDGKVMAADVAPPRGGVDAWLRRRRRREDEAEAAADERRQQQEDGGGGGGGGGDVDMADADGGGGGQTQLDDNGDDDDDPLLIGTAGYDRTVKLWAPQDAADPLGGLGDALPF